MTDVERRLFERVKALEAALKALAKRHSWQPELGPCICPAHETARKLLRETNP